MANFIKLTNPYTHYSYWLNIEGMECMRRYTVGELYSGYHVEIEHTKIYGSTDDPYHAAETPQEILKLMRGE